MYRQFWGNENLSLYNELVQKAYGGVSVGRMDIARDAPVLSSTTGTFNAKFGAQVFQQLEMSSVLFNLLPKFPYKKAGFRARTARSNSSGVGVSENANIPATTKATFAEVKVPTKEMSIAMDYSQRTKLLAKTEDDTAYDFATILEDMKSDFVYAVDKDMNQDVTTTASSNIESIERIASSYAEVNNCSDVNANDADIYTVDGSTGDRDGGPTWKDAYVSHNSNTDRTLTDSVVRDLLENSISNGANASTQVWYTGTDTWNAIQGLYQGTNRNSALNYSATGSVNEDGKFGGAAFGAELATLYGRPIYIAPSGKVTANGTLSNLYLLDVGTDPRYNEPILGVKTLQAPMLATTELEDYPAHGKLGNETVIYAAMELECKNFKRQAKARDLASA